MIRVFKANDRDFSTNGDVVIVPIKARVKNSINGDFTLELVCNSKYNDYLEENNLLIVPTPQGEQAFRISNNVQKKGDRITLKLKHVFYDSDNLVIADSYAVDMTCKQALNHFNDATDITSPFTCDSDINHIDSFRCVRKSFLECIDTILERWGGYLVRDNWNIAIKSEIGRDSGVTIRYKKNLQELTATYDYSTVVTKLLPVGKDGILLPELYVFAPKQYEVPYSKVISFEQDIDEEDYPSETAYQNAVITDLRAQAQKYVDKAYKPTVTYSLKGKPAKVSDIGDIIRVYDERIGVDITTEVISYEWDIITESYVNLTFGNFSENLGNLMSTIKGNTNAQINEATSEIKGKYNSLLQGSYVVYRGYDILLLDKIPIDTASHVLRFSNNGISISLNGVNGTYHSVYDLETEVLSVPIIKLNGEDLQDLLNAKQDTLTAGDGITISRVDGKLVISTVGVASAEELSEDEYNRLAPFYVRDNDTVYFIKDKKKIKYHGTTYSGALEYWTETEESFNRTWHTANPRGWSFNETYGRSKWDTIVQDDSEAREWAEELDYTIPIVRCEWEDSDHYRWLGYVAISDRFQDVYYSAGYMPIVIGGKTFYYGGYNGALPVSNNAHWVKGDGVIDIGYRGTYEETLQYALSLFNIEVYYNRYQDTGIGIGENIIWGGNREAESDPYPFYVDNEGRLYAEKVTVDGVEISTDFSGSTSLADGTSGLVPAPTSSDTGKYLSSDGTWKSIQGADVEANPTGVATTTLTKLRVDGVIYDVPSGSGSIVVDYYDYIKFSNGSFISLPYSVNADYMIEVEFECNDYVNDQHIIGNTDGASYLHLTQYNGEYYTSNGSGEQSFSETLTGKHKFLSNYNNGFYFDEVYKGGYTPTTNTNAVLLIGKRDNVANFIGKIYNYKITSISTGNVLLNLVPVRVSAGGIIIKEGLVDTITSKVYEVNGVLGNDQV